MIAGAVFFDVDGTLVPGTSSSQFLGARLGHLAELAEAEESYRVGRIDNQEVSVLDASGWSGRGQDEVNAWLRDLPVVDGISAVVARCRELALAPYLATLAWAPVGEYLCERFGFEGACGPRLASAEGIYSGEVAAHLDEFGKRDYALAIARSLGLAAPSCAAVGDSRSDLPLFEEVGFSIAFNGDNGIAARSDVVIVSKDLRAILPSLEGWARSLQTVP
jgi:phosphoserine phosphatase